MSNLNTPDNNTENKEPKSFNNRIKNRGKAIHEIEHVILAKLLDFSQLKQASYAEELEQYVINVDRTEHNAGSGKVRVRKITPHHGRTRYEITTKSNTKDGNIEVTVATTEQNFIQFKVMAESGILKHRYHFPIKGTEFTWFVDVVPDGNGGYYPWAQCECHVNDINTKPPALPIKTEESIAKPPLGKMSDEEWEEESSPIYKRFFDTGNPYVKKAENKITDLKTPNQPDEEYTTNQDNRNTEETDKKESSDTTVDSTLSVDNITDDGEQVENVKLRAKEIQEVKEAKDEEDAENTESNETDNNETSAEDGTTDESNEEGEKEDKSTSNDGTTEVTKLSHLHEIPDTIFDSEITDILSTESLKDEPKAHPYLLSVHNAFVHLNSDVFTHARERFSEMVTVIKAVKINKDYSLDDSMLHVFSEFLDLADSVFDTRLDNSIRVADMAIEQVVKYHEDTMSAIEVLQRTLIEVDEPDSQAVNKVMSVIDAFTKDYSLLYTYIENGGLSYFDEAEVDRLSTEGLNRLVNTHLNRKVEITRESLYNPGYIQTETHIGDTVIDGVPNEYNTESEILIKDYVNVLPYTDTGVDPVTGEYNALVKLRQSIVDLEEYIDTYHKAVYILSKDNPDNVEYADIDTSFFPTRNFKESTKSYVVTLPNAVTVKQYEMLLDHMVTNHSEWVSKVQSEYPTHGIEDEAFLEYTSKLNQYICWAKYLLLHSNVKHFINQMKDITAEVSSESLNTYKQLLSTFNIL